MKKILFLLLLTAIIIIIFSRPDIFKAKQSNPQQPTVAQVEAKTEPKEKPQEKPRVEPQKESPTEESVPKDNDSDKFVAPDLTPQSSGEIIEHTYYTIAYDEEHEQAKWVYYTLTPDMVKGAVKRKDDFRADPKVSTISAELSDYAGSGYDRGHLCPAASMSVSAEAMSQSFYLSNMSPQVPSFNRGSWKKLEELVRKWAIVEERIEVVTGPIFKDNLGSIGANNVTVPGYYYKVVYAPNSDKMIAFIMPNQKIKDPLDTYIQSVDSVEMLTGIDFYAGMNDSIESSLESVKNINGWEFTNLP